ncbi:MAG TPA: hypothetical protein VHG33_09590 [Woeseiaceae bacterium]|nr:hypothetical protein [Woeseiaceae bacterium]
MFMGHYGPGLVIKAARPALPLWLLFVAVQLVDVAWAVLVLLGIEKVRIVPGITESNALDLYYMPYTHSLVAALLWSLAAAVLWRLVPRARSWPVAAWLGLAVFSHWVLDLLVHRPDLPLYSDVFKVGFGLWNFPMLALGLEALLFFGCMFVYLKRTTAVGTFGRYGMPVFGLVLLVFQAAMLFGPPPPSSTAAAVSALVAYALVAAVAYWLDRQRVRGTFAGPGA